MFKKLGIISALLAISLGTASAITIADINDPNGNYKGSITFGDKTFSNLSSQGALDSSVTVSFEQVGNNISIIFNGPWNITSGDADFGLQYKVTVNDPAWLISSIGQAVTGAIGNPLASVQIDESVWGTGFEGYPLVAQSTVIKNGDSVDPPGEFSDTLVLVADVDSDQTPTPLSMVWVTKDIFLNAGSCRQEEVVTAVVDNGCQQFASATRIKQTFYQTPSGDIPDVPEPATMLLFSTALLGLGIMRRKKS